MNQVWVVAGECGDYYCGCGLGHLIAICHSEERAKIECQLAKEVTTTYIRKDGTEDKHRDYYDTRVEGPIEIDARLVEDTIIDQREN